MSSQKYKHFLIKKSCRQYLQLSIFILHNPYRLQSSKAKLVFAFSSFSQLIFKVGQ